MIIKRLFSIEFVAIVFHALISFLFPLDSKEHKFSKYILLLSSIAFSSAILLKKFVGRRFYKPIKVSYSNAVLAAETFSLPSLNTDRYTIPFKLRTGIQHTVASYKSRAPAIVYEREIITPNQLNIPNDLVTIDWAYFPEMIEKSENEAGCKEGARNVANTATQPQVLGSLQSLDSINSMMSVSSCADIYSTSEDKIPKDAPIVIILHSLGGGSKERCVRRFAKECLDKGFRPVVVIARGFAGTVYNKQVVDQYIIYHHNMALDKDLYVESVRNQYNLETKKDFTINNTAASQVSNNINSNSSINSVAGNVNISGNVVTNKIGPLCLSSFMDLDEWPMYKKSGYPVGHFHTLGMDFRDALTTLQHVDKKYPNAAGIYFVGFSIGGIQVTHLASFVSGLLGAKEQYRMAYENLRTRFGGISNTDIENSIKEFNLNVMKFFNEGKGDSVVSEKKLSGNLDTYEEGQYEGSEYSDNSENIEENENVNSNNIVDNAIEANYRLDFKPGYFTKEKRDWYDDYMFIKIYETCKKINGYTTLFENWNRGSAESFDRDHSMLANSVIRWLKKNMEYVKETTKVSDEKIEQVLHGNSLGLFESNILVSNSHYENRQQYNDDLFAPRLLNNIKYVPLLALNSRDDPIAKDYIPDNFAIQDAFKAMEELKLKSKYTEETDKKELSNLSSVIIMQFNEGGHLGGIIGKEKVGNKLVIDSAIWGADYYGKVAAEFLLYRSKLSRKNKLTSRKGESLTKFQISMVDSAAPTVTLI